MSIVAALGAVPAGLRTPLLGEYREITQNYAEHRWGPSELSGGKFCEIVYTILDGFATGTYASTPSKPANFVGACRALENHAQVPRSFQILIPRMLPPLYEVRNNRGVGHVGGDVDPNHMDATAVLSMCSWVMAELVRVLHGLTIPQAQALVDSLVERRIPIVWQSGNIRRVLRPKMSLPNQVLVLIASSPAPIPIADVASWTEIKNMQHFRLTIKRLHSARMLNHDAVAQTLEILPPGSAAVAELIALWKDK